MIRLFSQLLVVYIIKVLRLNIFLLLLGRREELGGESFSDVGVGVERGLEVLRGGLVEFLGGLE